MGQPSNRGAGSNLIPPLGVHCTVDGLTCAVVSRHAEQVWLCIFDAHDTEIQRVSLATRHGDVWYASLPGQRAGTRYGWRADGPWQPDRGHRFDVSKLLVDPYATALDRPFHWHPDLARRGIDTSAIVPKAIVPEASMQAAGATALSLAPIRPHSDLIYEIAVKSFTARHPAVPERQRGTVAALAHPAVLNHLRRLQVGMVELMPLAAAIDERHLVALGLRNAWGYNPVTFMAPDPQLAPGGIDEIAATVATLHAAGIGVILDVVFNHTGESDDAGPTLSLRGLDNALYYAHDSQGRLINHTGCGNTLALDRSAGVQLVMDALRFWVRAAGIDGFRFDLAPINGRVAGRFTPDAPLLAAIQQDPLLSTRMLVAEPWDVGPDGYQLGQFGQPWREWNDRARDDFRRFWRGDGGAAGAFATRLAGSADLFAGQHRPPSASINYVAAHDGFALADLVAYADKHNDANGEGNRDGTTANWSWNHGVEGATDDPTINAARRCDVRALIASLLMARGTPMLTAGDEFGRSQSGNNNAYAQDNATTWADWANADQDLIAFVAGMMALRIELPLLSVDRHLTGRTEATAPFPDAQWLSPDGRALADQDWAATDVLGLQLFAGTDRLCLWFNRRADGTTVALPEARPDYDWCRRCDSASAWLGDQPALTTTLTLSGRTVSLYQERLLPETSRRKVGAADTAIVALAASHGIEREWYEVDGTYHAVSIDSQRALLKALRVPVDSAADSADYQIERSRKTLHRALPETVLVAQGQPLSVRLSWPVATGIRPAELVLQRDDGSAVRIDVKPSDLAHVTAGDTVVSASFRLPEQPIGVHRLVHDQAPDQACTLIVAPPTAHRLADETRLFGLTSHLYALRHDGDTGIGDFGSLAQFLTRTAALGGAFAGINPLHHLFTATRDRASPYQPSDRHRLDPIYIDLTALAAHWSGGAGAAALGAAAAELSTLSELAHVDYARVWHSKAGVLNGFWQDFQALSPTSPAASDFARFVVVGGNRLAAHAQYETSVAIGRSASTAQAIRSPQTFPMWLQWVAEQQLAKASATGRAAGLALGLYRDLALGTAFDGGEVWAEPTLFADGVSLGAPPDPFSRSGQVWNLAPYNPMALELLGFEPFQALLAANMRHAGLLRIDHILGLMRQFWVPKGADGSAGAYIRQPLDILLAITAIESQRAGCAIIGEDLGTVPDGLRQAMSATGILSYLVLWFERQGPGFKPPSSYPKLAAACLSSHDLPTFRGWQQGFDIDLDVRLGRLDEHQRQAAVAARADERAAIAQLAAPVDPTIDAEGGGLAAAVHRAVAQSPAMLMLVQADDLTGETEPLNLPGTDTERPNWRRRLSSRVADIGTTPAAIAILDGVRAGR